jgi:hypothetical protein
MANIQRNKSTINILFIGNSFTARNDLPGLIAQLASAQSKSVEHLLISAGGASLRAHWNAGHALPEIKSGQYDYVVLQEQSTLPVKNAKRMHENVRLFNDAIRASGAKMVLYMTWAKQQVPKSQKAITAAYETIGKELGAIVVPVGIAWQRFLKAYKHPVLHDKDGSHSTLAGSYLAACVFFTVLFQQTPVGNTAEIRGLDTKDRLVLQKVAWQSVPTKKASQS